MTRVTTETLRPEETESQRESDALRAWRPGREPPPLSEPALLAWLGAQNWTACAKRAARLAAVKLLTAIEGAPLDAKGKVDKPELSDRAADFAALLIGQPMTVVEAATAALRRERFATVEPRHLKIALIAARRDLGAPRDRAKLALALHRFDALAPAARAELERCERWRHALAHRLGPLALELLAAPGCAFAFDEREGREICGACGKRGPALVPPEGQELRGKWRRFQVKPEEESKAC